MNYTLFDVIGIASCASIAAAILAGIAVYRAAFKNGFKQAVIGQLVLKQMGIDPLTGKKTGDE